MTGQGLRDEFEARVEARLEEGEKALDWGSCRDITEQGTTDLQGGNLVHVLITDRRLIWGPPQRLPFLASLQLDDVDSCAEETVKHRYAIRLTHAPLDRLHTVPAHDLILFKWGDKDVVGSFTTTILVFSRRDTLAARALRVQLSRRGVL
jgi:hypothetical protein